MTLLDRLDRWLAQNPKRAFVLSHGSESDQHRLALRSEHEEEPDWLYCRDTASLDKIRCQNESRLECFVKLALNEWYWCYRVQESVQDSVATV